MAHGQDRSPVCAPNGVYIEAKHSLHQLCICVLYVDRHSQEHCSQKSSSAVSHGQLDHKVQHRTTVMKARPLTCCNSSVDYPWSAISRGTVDLCTGVCALITLCMLSADNARLLRAIKVWREGRFIQKVGHAHANLVYSSVYLSGV